MNRRNFIRAGCTGCLSLSAIPLLFNSCATLKNTTGKLVNDGIILSTNDFLLNEKGSSAYRSFIVVRNEALKYPVCVFRFTPTEYSAVWMQCTHQGAELQAAGDYLQCPAHGSEFNNKGKVKGGPADEDLKTFPVTISGKDIFIDLRKQT